MKKYMKRFLLFAFWRSRPQPASEHDLQQRSLFDADKVIRAGFAKNNIWLFSQPKSGTTFLCNTVAFYNAACAGITHDDFDDLPRFGVLRSGRARHVIESDRIADALEFLRRFSPKRLLVHSHQLLEGCQGTVILQSRNPYDFCVSAFHFRYKNRQNREHITVMEALPSLIDGFAAVWSAQKRILATNPEALVVYYEDLVGNPKDTLGRLIEHIYDEFDDRALSQALALTAAENVKRWERKQQRPILVETKGGFTSPHFIRSGKVGEHREFFSDKELAFIRSVLRDRNVPEDGRF
jgi:hypothetical protein